jgi:CHAT domain-containing protein
MPMTRRLATVWLAWLALAAGSPALEPPHRDGVLIDLDAAGKLRVQAIDVAEVERNPPSHGLFVWAIDDEPERWAIVKPGWTRPAEPVPQPEVVASLRSRTAGADSAAGIGAAAFTVQLEQITPSTSTRDAGLMPLTPCADGRLLTSRPTFRRAPADKGPPYPAARGILTDEKRTWRVPVVFPAEKVRVPFSELRDLPAECASGLPAGRYTFGPDAGGAGAFVTFIVEEPAEREAVLRPIEKMAELVGSRTDPTFVQFAVDHLLGFRGDRDAPLYLADVLDLLDSVPSPTKHMTAQRDRVLSWLRLEPGRRGDALVPVAAPGDDTGIAAIDAARREIAAGRWSKALGLLDGAAAAADRTADVRLAALAILYRGVVLSEAGVNKSAETRAAFEKAIRLLDAGTAADRFRARVNYANFLQRIATDRVWNHALQMAAGVPRPFLETLTDWLEARKQYGLALAEKVDGPGQKAAIESNLARLHALLGDVVRTLDVPVAGKRSLESVEAAANRTARDLADRAATDPTAEPQVRGVAEEVRALLAYRAGDDKTATASARAALAVSLDLGQLAGAENAYRVLGLIAEKTDPREALRNYRIAQLVTESLRERFPADRTGQTRAGFFARKVYVADKIVELLLADKKPREALEVLEQAKARSLQDLLAARGMRVGAGTSGIGPLLADWPAKTVALEYFLGGQVSHLLVIDAAGTVTDHVLRDARGEPISPRDLVAEVHDFLAAVPKQAGKLYARLSTRRGYDNRWQDDLARLHDELIPPAVRDKMKDADLVVIVPQHILHYFPFAALVTEKDGQATKAKMARPRFLVDEPFALVTAPSLATWHRGPARSMREVRAIGVAEAPGAPVLAGVVKDLANLRDVFGPRVRSVLDGDEASESGVKKLLPQRGLLFFATHGLSFADHPLDSHLLLMPETQNNGQLSAGDLFGLRVNADLVVMSACWSGLGDRSPMPGDELVGLSRAFLSAGAPTVVAGLWDVYDATAPDLMLGFFKGLAKGRPAAQALADSQRTFLAGLRSSGEDEPWLHPYFWAVYTVSGDDRTKFVP